MKILVLEDEAGAAQNLLDLLSQVDQHVEILEVIETVSEAVAWLSTHDNPDLGLFDIRLADGNSFEVMEQVDVRFPIIFTTAYDEYALKAFKVNSIDYLLKPVQEHELEGALRKYKNLFEQPHDFDNAQLMKVVEAMSRTSKQSKKAFLIHQRGRMLPIKVEDIAYFLLENGLLKAHTFDQQSFVLEETLNEVEMQVNEDQFFRANRQAIISRRAVKAVDKYFHRKLKLELDPPEPEEVLVSKAKVRPFMQWLSGDGRYFTEED